MAYLGCWEIDQYLPIPATCHRFSTGAAYLPTTLTYSIYEEAGTTGLYENVDMVPASPFDSITGLYYARVQLTTAAGFEENKNYIVVIKATVDSVAAIETHTFQIKAAIASVADYWSYATRELTGTQAFNLTGDITGNLSGSVGSVTGAVGSVTGAVGSVTGAVGSVTGAVGSVTAVSTGAITAASFAADSITAAALKADAISEISLGTALLTGTAQASTTTYIVLAAATSAIDDYYNGCLVSIVSGTGAGQCRLIADYIGATDIAVVDSPWEVAPDITSVYRIDPFSGILLADTGVVAAAAAGPPSTITLAGSASVIADTYIGHTIYISSGTGIGQARLITAYTAGKVATVSPAWTTVPVVNASVYKILPVGRTYVNQMAAGVIDSNSFAAGAITAASIATGAIDADALATDAVTELVAAEQSKGMKKNTEFANFMILMRDSTNHNPVTGKTVTAQRSIGGAALAACANAVSEVSNGIYKITLAAADLNGDSIMFRFSSAGCDDLLVWIKTQS